MINDPGAHIEIEGTPYMLDSRLVADIKAVNDRVALLRSEGKLSPEVLNRIRRYFRIKNIYHSNAIEGNILDVGETRLVVEAGLTITGKPLKDQAEARNLGQALDYLEELASQPDLPLTEHDIRTIHTFVLAGIDDAAGGYRTVEVEISGSQFKPPGPESVGPQMRDFGSWLSGASVDDSSALGVVATAAAAHAWFVNIHPFIDGNGRVARLIMNLVLMRRGYPIAVITREDRARYYDALEESQAADLSSFVGLVLESIDESLDEYEAAVAEHREQEEWARSIVSKFTEKERIRAQNEFEVWRSAMDLLKSYFRQTAQTLDESAVFGRVYFKDFGNLEFEKYASLRRGNSAKRTWFFRLDFRSGDKAARYLFFFGSPSHPLYAACDVTAHISREESPYHFERLDSLGAPDVPALREVGYDAQAESFVGRYVGNRTKHAKIEDIGRQFIEEVVAKHFGAAE